MCSLAHQREVKVGGQGTQRSGELRSRNKKRSLEKIIGIMSRRHEVLCTVRSLLWAGRTNP